MATDTSIQIVREDPNIEAYKLGLLKSAKDLADTRIDYKELGAQQQIAGMSEAQKDAIKQATAQGGIGGYQAYLAGAGQTMGLAPGQVVGTPTYDAQGNITGYTGGTTPEALGRFRAASGQVSGQQIQSYMNPYQQAVQDEINRAYDIQAQQARLGSVGQPGGPSAFGGSRAEIASREIDRNRAQALAQSQAQNFLQAQQAAEREMARGFQAAQGIGSLGLQTGSTLSQMGLQQAQLGDLAQQQALRDISTQFEFGKQQQAQQQAEIEANRQNIITQAFEPYQRLGFLSDIYKGAPTTQMAISSATSPTASSAERFLGLGIAGLSAATGASKAGLF